MLEDANIKLSGVASDVLGVSGRAMLAAMIDGTDDPEALAGLARGTLRRKAEELKEALLGLVTDHHRFQLRMLLRQLDQLDGLIAGYGARIEEAVGQLAEAAERLRTIPGLGGRTAEVIVGEISPDIKAFPRRAICRRGPACAG